GRAYLGRNHASTTTDTIRTSARTLTAAISHHRGYSTPSMRTVPASTAATVALDVDVPTMRMSALKPFADAVSLWGTADMMSIGIAAYAIEMPSVVTLYPIMISSGLP